jgi:uncharacterized phage-associated protein
MALATNVAKYLLSLIDGEKGQVISNLALQKLLYYCQGYYLAYTENREALFEEDILAWRWGPVVENVYQEYRDYGSASLPSDEPTEHIENNLSEEQREVIRTVNDTYKGFSAIALMEKTHSESPWRETEQSCVITRDKMYNFFKGKIIK